MNLFLDDQKIPILYKIDPADVTIFRSGEEAMEYVMDTKASIDTLYLDHDLGMGMSGYGFLCLLVETYKIPIGKVVIISLSPPGIKRIITVCEKYNIPYEQRRLDI